MLYVHIHIYICTYIHTYIHSYIYIYLFIIAKTELLSTSPLPPSNSKPTRTSYMTWIILKIDSKKKRITCLRNHNRSSRFSTFGGFLSHGIIQVTMGWFWVPRLRKPPLHQSLRFRGMVLAAEALHLAGRTAGRRRAQVTTWLSQRTRRHGNKNGGIRKLWRIMKISSDLWNQCQIGNH
jgi:hypothetical protein